MPQSGASIMTHWSKRVLGVICSFALAPFLGLCFFVHPAADDYVFAIMVRDLGFGAAQHDWYTNWTGRFVSTALISMASFDLRLSSFSCVRSRQARPLLAISSS